MYSVLSLNKTSRSSANLGSGKNGRPSTAAVSGSGAKLREARVGVRLTLAFESLLARTIRFRRSHASSPLSSPAPASPGIASQSVKTHNHAASQANTTDVITTKNEYPAVKCHEKYCTSPNHAISFHLFSVFQYSLRNFAQLNKSSDIRTTDSVRIIQ